MERCKQVEQSADVTAGAGAEVVLATETDRGMARSGQRDTPGDLASCPGWRHAFGDEFVELGLGGDLNTKGFLQAGLAGSAVLDGAAEPEPSFAHIAAEGFDCWQPKSGAHTSKLHPEDPPDSPLTMLDWLLVRNECADRPFVVPACVANGENLSDHEMVGTTVWP